MDLSSTLSFPPSKRQCFEHNAMNTPETRKLISFEILLNLQKSGMDLIFILLLLILVDLEVAQFIALLGVRYYTQPVTQVVLLEILLGKIFQVPENNKQLSFTYSILLQLSFK